ncbi:nitrous oxide-stimulated promoter family protein [Sutterella sp.]|uniref:nitrous oxide-stimulated promoter family protein n=1 Tax=Sutterella sp. TaxID=1981025 RepID=UPI0026E01193|nr:nitrous oxide-stimulated promoter family protein [Sutterella sp.]MDO5531202.1 nitrous oxide-stimulated promoter family protein [Sutterella sp.]
MTEEKETTAPAVRPKPKDRMARLEEIPRLKEEAATIRIMTGDFCAHFHGTDGKNLCPACQEFLAYALKRLACCPYGGEKPVCGKCKIHCYKPREREVARKMMRWAGPRLIWTHPRLAVQHLIDLRREAPEKPRNTARPARPAPDSERKN